MIRTTISRIKRVWAVTFSPGLLRGDVGYSPGKFKLLASTTQNCLPTRSASTGDESKDEQGKVQSGGEARSEEETIFEDNLSSKVGENERVHGAPPLYRTTAACRCDECNKDCEEIKAQNISDMTKKLQTNTAQLNMSDNFGSDRFTNDKAQLELFGRKKANDVFLTELREKNVDIKSVPNMKETFQNIFCHEVVLTDDTGDKKSKNLAADAHQMYTNLYDVHPEEYQCKPTDNKKNLSSKKSSSDRKVDRYWKDVYETAVGENSVYCERTADINKDSLNMYQALAKNAAKVDATMHLKCSETSPKEMAQSIEGSEKLAVTASVQKQGEEQLTQKLEHIDEAPLVEAEKSKVEGSQIVPKILGNADRNELLNSLDEVAKRCLTSPQSKIDEILLKEMEKLGIPLTVQKPTGVLKISDNKEDTSNKPKNVPKEGEFELLELDRKSKPQKLDTLDKSNIIEEPKQLAVNPPNAAITCSCNFNETKLDEDLKSKDKANIEPLTGVNMYNVHTGNKYEMSYAYVKSSDKKEPRRSGTSEQECNTNFNDKMWQKNHLDPKHVLTCNETCSISPKPLIYKNVNDVGGDVRYEQPVHKEEYMKENQRSEILEESGRYPSGAEAGYVSDYNINSGYRWPSKPLDFTYLSKNVNSGAMPADNVEHHTTESKTDVLQPEFRRTDNYRPLKNESEDTEQVTQEKKEDPYAALSTGFSEQLQVASEQLQATSEHLQITTEQLQAATIQLQTTSNYLCDSSEKLLTASDNLSTTTDKLQIASESLRDKNEAIEFEQKTLKDKIASYLSPTSNRETWSSKENKQNAAVYFAPAATTVMSSQESSCVKSSEAEKSSSKLVATKDTGKSKDTKANVEKTDLKKVDDEHYSSNIEGWAQQAATISPSVSMADESPQLMPLPEINEKVKLSDLMKLVRERNRLIDHREATVLAKTKKPMLPMAKPMAHPSPTQMPTYPVLKPIPRVCSPKTGRPSTKCSRCDLEKLGFDQNASIFHNQSRESLDVASLDLAPAFGLTPNLAEYILQQHLCDIESSYQRLKVEFLEAAVLVKSRQLAKIFRSQDYEPWSPIPSWPYPKKPKRQKLQCPKDGCKMPPPVCVEDRPCGLKPCKTFPTFPRRTFSLLDCYPTYLRRHKIVDVGEF